MEPPCPSFADEFNVPQEYAVLVFDVRRAAVSLPFQVHRLKLLVEAGLVAISSAYFEFADEVPEEAQHSLAHLPKIFSSHLHGLSKVVLWGSARRCLLASSLCCHAAFISASTPSLVRQLCGPRGRLERGTNSTGMESMTSAMSVAMSPMQVPSGIDESASIIVFVCNLASKVRVSHQPPKVGQLQILTVKYPVGHADARFPGLSSISVFKKSVDFLGFSFCTKQHFGEIKNKLFF